MNHLISLKYNKPRSNWKQQVEEAGLLWHGSSGDSYWMENQHIELSLAAAELLEGAANQLHEMCLTTCETIARKGWWDRLFLPKKVIPFVEASWQNKDPHLYGRFDFAWNGTGAPKLLEYNADTPTSLLEASIIQWQWLESHFPQADQLNSLHETIVERWQHFSEKIIHFACDWEHLEDRQTIAYLAECAEQSGKTVHLIDINEVGYHPQYGFVDAENIPIHKLFKLYPWEWMAHEEFFDLIHEHRLKFLEPAWKMMLSNKAFLPLLWELFPNHPFLLPASSSLAYVKSSGIADWVSKPCFGREGIDVSFLNSNALSPSISNHGSMIYQQKAPMLHIQETTFVWGLWMIENECRGLSIRGDTSPITGNGSKFFPHVII